MCQNWPSGQLPVKTLDEGPSILLEQAKQPAIMQSWILEFPTCFYSYILDRYNSKKLIRNSF